MSDVIKFPVATNKRGERKDHIGKRVPVYSRSGLTTEDEITRLTVGIKCRDCGETIPPRRLKLAPNTIRCVDCQSGAEAEGWRS